jgi:two-component system response regulator HydG
MAARAGRRVHGRYDLVITDLRMGDHDGIDVLRAIKEAQPMTEVIVMTAYGTIESAVEAMRLGAFDYIQKPFGEQELLVKVTKAIESRRLHGQVRLFAQEFKERYHFENIVGRSQSIRDVLAKVVKIAPTDAIVLITGDSGTGKELVARAVHVNSRRAERPFVTVNCAAITETLLESELFGHARGAFTGAVSARKGLFEEADGGTFFFDEIAETTMSFQAKLLRAIQDGEIRRVGENRPIKVNIRVVAATNVDLVAAVEERRFRQDLYYRLNVARFHLPPLRERRRTSRCSPNSSSRSTPQDGHAARFSDEVMERPARARYRGTFARWRTWSTGRGVCSGGVITVDDILPQAPPRAARTRQDARRHRRRGRARGVEAALKAFDGVRERAAEALTSVDPRSGAR